MCTLLHVHHSLILILTTGKLCLEHQSSVLIDKLTKKLFKFIRWCTGCCFFYLSFCCDALFDILITKSRREGQRPYLRSCGCRRHRRWASWRCAPWSSVLPSPPAAGCVSGSATWEEERRGSLEGPEGWGGWWCAAGPSRCCRDGPCCCSRRTAAPSCCRCWFGRSCLHSCCGCSWSWRIKSAWVSAAEKREKAFKRMKQRGEKNKINQ